MQGIEDNKFGPEENLTRGMLVTVLWRMEGEPNTDYKVTFNNQNDIMTGDTDGKFEPKSNTTRAQAASVLMRISENFK